MKAIVLRGTGGPEVLAVEDVPQPEPGPGEVLIDVAFCGCNWADTQIRKGVYPHVQALPFIMGFEVSGTVIAVGEGVDASLEGAPVAAIVPGAGYAERVAVAASDLIRLPPGMSLEQAAAFPIQALTAYHMLTTIYRTSPGDIVLCHAIGGGLGQYVTQIGVRKGARVFGTTGTPGKEEAPLRYGAERVIATGTEDFVAVMEEETSGQGVDLVIDSLGATTLDRSYDVLRPLGHVISIGEAEGMPFTNIRERLLPKSLTFTRFHLGHVPVESDAWAEGIEFVTDSIVDGSLEVPIAGIYGISEAARMHADLEGRRITGKLLLDPKSAAGFLRG
jgi:NADPH2:quinone reductase